MKKITVLLGIALAFLIACYVGYRLYFPVIIAQSITTAETSPLIPEEVKAKIEKIKKPVNESAATVIQAIHTSDITLAQILHAIDEAEEEKAYAMLEELQHAEIKNPDQVFDMAKKYFPVDFDVEKLRKPFKQRVTMRLIRKGIKYATRYRDNEELDIATVKSIAKKILIQKEKEFNQLMQAR